MENYCPDLRLCLGASDGNRHGDPGLAAPTPRRGTVTGWRARFLRRRLDGLSDEPRPGMPRTITDAQVEEVVVGNLGRGGGRRDALVQAGADLEGGHLADQRAPHLAGLRLAAAQGRGLQDLLGRAQRRYWSWEPPKVVARWFCGGINETRAAMYA